MRGGHRLTLGGVVMVLGDFGGGAVGGRSSAVARGDTSSVEAPGVHKSGRGLNLRVADLLSGLSTRVAVKKNGML